MAVAHASPRPLLPWLLLLALAHMLVAATVRPLFQVSDEVNYLASAQRVALTIAPASLAPCVSPPDGAPPADMPTGGKALFHRVAAHLLVTACRAGAGDAAPIWVRVCLGLSLVLVTGAGWATARLVQADPWVTAATAFLLATQPVLAKYSGAVTPDSLANAAAALAVWSAVHWLARGPSWGSGIGMLAASATAAAFKDTGLVLVPVHGLLMAVTLVRASGGRPWPRRVGLGLLVATVVVALGAATRTAYPVGTGVRVALDAPVAFASRVVTDLTTQMPTQVASTWTSLGGFGGLSAPLPTAASVLAVLGLVMAAVGLVLAQLRHGTTWAPAVATYAAAVVIGCLLQAPVRQALLDMQDQHQGRWLFPAAVPVALALATGLAGALGPLRRRAWALLALAGTTTAALAFVSVASWHAGAGGHLDLTHLFTRATGGLDINDPRITVQASQAWAGSGGLTVALPFALAFLLCGVLVARQAPRPSTTHERHPHHR